MRTVLGEKIRRLREARGLTQDELGELVGLTQGMISHIEVGRKRPGLETLMDLARVFSVPLCDLVHALEEDIKKGEGAPSAPVSNTPAPEVPTSSTSRAGVSGKKVGVELGKALKSIVRGVLDLFNKKEKGTEWDVLKTQTPLAPFDFISLDVSYSKKEKGTA